MVELSVVGLDETFGGHFIVLWPQKFLSDPRWLSDVIFQPRMILEVTSATFPRKQANIELVIAVRWFTKRPQLASHIGDTLGFFVIEHVRGDIQFFCWSPVNH